MNSYRRTSFEGDCRPPSTPKVLYLSAQGCEERATLGVSSTDTMNPERVESSTRFLHPLCMPQLVSMNLPERGLFYFVVRHLHWLSRVPGLPQLFDALLLTGTCLTHRSRLAAMEKLEAE